MAFADDDERSTAFACRVVLTSMAYHALVDVETLGDMVAVRVVGYEQVHVSMRSLKMKTS
jgi:hypothetical protein